MSNHPSPPERNTTDTLSKVRPEVLAPDSTLIRIPEVCAITGLRRATLYKRLKTDPTFPRPVKLGDSEARSTPVAFVLGEIQDWVRSKIAAR